MSTYSSVVPGVSRIKAAIGMLAVTAALAGTMQAAVPATASAQKDIHAEYCQELISAADFWAWAGNYPVADRLWALYQTECTQA